MNAVGVSLEDRDGDTLAVYIKSALQNAKIEYNSDVHFIVTDNAAKMLLAGRRPVPYDLDQDLWQSTCSSHIGNLIFEVFEKNDPEFFRFVKSITTAFRHPHLEALLLFYEAKKMIAYPETRWCYARDFIQ